MTITYLKNENRINVGLLFGSFNPVHIGHLALANYILEFSELNEIWFVVTPHNPLKEGKELAHESHRLQMIKTAINCEPKFKACDIEFNMPRPSYTIDTIEKLEELHSNINFTIIMGSDNLLAINKWKDPQKVIQRNIFIYPRPGYTATKENIYSSTMQLINAPLLDISSTTIRDAIKTHKNLQFFMPQGVNEYINNNNLYR